MDFFENQWVEVFQIGEQTDSAGNTKKWTENDLNKIVEQYNAKKEEAPVVIGHPKDNAPAFGWVKSLKTDGRILFAKFKQLVPEFIEAVKQGLYKKRSISLYHDLTLKHVGFLGAMPPAIKGLADIKFSENNSITIEFSAKESTPMIDNEKEINELKAQLRKEQWKNRIAEFKEFINKLSSEGKIVSSQQDAIIELMEAVYGAGDFNFSEGKESVLNKFREYLEKQPKIVYFNELVKGENVKQISASEHLNLLAEERAKKHNLTYSEALSVVQDENADLAHKAAIEIN